jgi:hypothetical protein
MLRASAASIAIAVLLAAAPLLHARAQPDLGITLDGRLDEGEWKSASKREMEGGGTVHLMVRGDRLYIGVRGPAPGTAHVCIGSGEQVRLLHVSAAVGSAVYQQGEVGWRLRTPFEWRLREAGASGAPAAARAAYLEQEGWVGTVTAMGPDRELVIDRPRFGSKRLRIAVAYVPTPGDALGAVSRWPDTRDSCTDQKTVAGFLPQNAKFLVNDWAVVE